MVEAAPEQLRLASDGVRVVKAAPEQLRQHLNNSNWIGDISNTRKELEQEPRQGYIDLSKDPFPTEDVDQDQENIDSAGEQVASI